MLYLETLYWDSANTQKTLSYDPAQLRGAQIVLGPGEPIDPEADNLANPGGLPSRRTYAPGAVIVPQFCEDTDGVTITAQQTAPYAQVAVDPTATICSNGAGVDCDLVGSVGAPTGNTVPLSATTTHGPWSVSLDNITYYEERDQWGGLADGGYTAYFRDAAGCTDQKTFGIDTSGGGGTGGLEPPAGFLEIASFCTGVTGQRRYLFFNPTTKQIRQDFDQDPTCTVAGEPTVGEVLYDNCLPNLTYETVTYTGAGVGAAYAAQSNSTQCGYTGSLVVVSKSATGPTGPPPELGHLDLVVSGGAQPITLTIPGLPARMLDSNGYADVNAAPGSYVATATDSSATPLTLQISFVIPVYTPPAPVVVPALPGPAWQNLETFPFSTGGAPPDAQPAACLDLPYYLAVPTTGFLPFCLRRAPNPTRWLDCARLLDAETGYTVQEFNPRALNYQKFSDGGHDYFLYYGNVVTGLDLPTCRPLRLQVDEFTSAAFIAHRDLSGYLRASWWHDGPLQHLPYGTGLQQWLYIPGATLREGDPREESTVTKIPGKPDRVDFLAQARTVSFETEPLPAWLVQAVQGARLHEFFRAGDFQQGSRPR